jgi:DNA polymerase
MSANPRFDRETYLRRMGIDVWRPRAGARAAETVAGNDVPALQEPVVPVREPAVAVRNREPAVAVPASSIRVRDASGTSDVAALDWDALRAVVAGCTACPLHATRTQTVFGVGSPRADWLFIGEAPGADEDRQGEPFVGRAGQLLNAILHAIGLARERVYIANILKCRPPRNRDPEPSEAHACRPFLDRQITLIEPKIIVALGRIAAQQLLATDTPIGRLRGRVHEYAAGGRVLPVVVTYHPAYLLRSPQEKPKVWTDLRLARRTLAGVPA